MPQPVIVMAFAVEPANQEFCRRLGLVPAAPDDKYRVLGPRPLSDVERDLVWQRCAKGDLSVHVRTGDGPALEKWWSPFGPIRVDLLRHEAGHDFEINMHASGIVETTVTQCIWCHAVERPYMGGGGPGRVDPCPKAPAR